jgi:hypothetical protein
VLLCSSAAVFGLLGLTKKHSPGLSGLFSLSGLFGSQKELERPDRPEKLEKPNWLLEFIGFVEFIGLLEYIVFIGFTQLFKFINTLCSMRYAVKALLLSETFLYIRYSHLCQNWSCSLDGKIRGKGATISMVDKRLSPKSPR